jgi:hypothetical protein
MTDTDFEILTALRPAQNSPGCACNVKLVSMAKEKINLNDYSKLTTIDDVNVLSRGVCVIEKMYKKVPLVNDFSQQGTST